VGRWIVTRRLVVALLAVVALVTLAKEGHASTATTMPSGRPATECVSANPRPDCLETEEFDRNSRSHLLLFAVLGVALAGIATVVVRSTIRNGRARHASGPT
jgi:hypothetical protein